MSNLAPSLLNWLKIVLIRWLSRFRRHWLKCWECGTGGRLNHW